MKKTLYILLMVSFTFLITNCSCERKDNGLDISDGESYCVWDKAAVWDQPKKDAKYVAGLTLGERVTYLDEKESDGEGNKAKEFLKVKLNDGTEGWVQSNLLAANSKPAVFKSECKIYSRPDLLTVTNKSFSLFDFVAITEEKGEWLHVTGKRTGGKWIEDGWIKNGSTTSEEKDVATASYVNRAIAKYGRNENKLKEELEKISANPDLQGGEMSSILTSMIQARFYPEDEEYSSDEQEEVEEEVVPSADTIAAF